MSTLTVTAKGQVTLRKDLLRHLGVRPGEKIAVDKLPDGRIEMRAARPAGKFADVADFSQAGGRPVPLDRGDERDRGAGLGRPAVKITADTNVLVRAIAGDDARQSKAAQAALANADLVALRCRRSASWSGCCRRATGCLQGRSPRRSDA
jgi:bifunctional DNA-binding transcriptional regulator/antitoxin component of YhaV-PrlF toxin-antitoxin module